MAIELHLDVELHRPATFFLVQRLKSKLGEVLMLVLSSFLRVPRVSVLVHGVATAAMLLFVEGRLRLPLCCAAVCAGSAWPLCTPRRPAPPPADLAAGGSRSPRRRPWPCAMAQLGPVGPVVITGLTGGCPFIHLTKLVGCITI